MTNATEIRIVSDVAVVVGRFQINHIAHDLLFRRALEAAPKVIIVIGSSFRSRDPRNPFTAAERIEMIKASLSPQDLDRITFLPVRDFYDDERWARAVRSGVEEAAGHGARIALVGHRKDQTSYYLDLFPAWAMVPVGCEVEVNSTALRNAYFGDSSPGMALRVLKDYVSEGAIDYLTAWMNLPAYAAVKQYHAAVRKYRQDWPEAWYMTGDAMVRMNDHIALIQRGGNIGHGQWALPGGFLNAEFEQGYQAAVRELREETGLSFLPSVLRSALAGSATLDHPLRSPRGRIISQVFYFAFGKGDLPQLQAADDAMDARWVHINDLPEYKEKLFEDHDCAIERFLPGVWERATATNG